MPRDTSNLIQSFAVELKQMLAGLILVSAAVGVAISTCAVALAAPTWVAIALYPVACSLTLLALATLVSLRSEGHSGSGALVRQQA